MNSPGLPPDRAHACFGEHLIRRSRHIVQDRPSLSVRWADIPELSARDRRCPAAWQQYWQQSRRNGSDPRPSAFQAWHIPSWGETCERAALLSIADASCGLLLLLLLSVGGQSLDPQGWISRPGPVPLQKVVVVSDLRVHGIAYEARWYSLITPPSTLRCRTGVPSGTTTGSFWSGGSWFCDWCGR